LDLSELIEEWRPRNDLLTENLSDIESEDEIDCFEDDDEEKQEKEKVEDKQDKEIDNGEDKIDDEKEKIEDEKEKNEDEKEKVVNEGEENGDEEQVEGEKVKVKSEDKVSDVEMDKTDTDASTKVDDPDSISLTIDKSDHFEDDMTEKKEGADDVDALSDLSLSGDEFENEKPDAEEVVKVKTEKNDEKDDSEKKPEMCTKCDVSHIVGEKRCSFLLKSSSDSGRKYSKHWERNDRGRDRERPRVRTLPSELYHLPRRDSRDRYRSRSPSPRARPRRVAPPAPSPPGYEERRERESRSRYDDEKRFRYDDHGSEVGYRTSSNSFSHHTHHESSPYSSGSGQMNEYFKPLQTPLSMTTNNGAAMGLSGNVAVGGMMAGATNPMFQNQTPISSHPGYSVASQSYQPQPSFQVTDQLPVNYTESLASLQPLQVFMSNKMASMPGQPYPKNYIDLLISNVGKMLAQANLGLRELNSAFRHQGEEFLRGLLSKELQVYAERFPGGVNLPMIIQATVEYLVINKYM